MKTASSISSATSALGAQIVTLRHAVGGVAGARVDDVVVALAADDVAALVVAGRAERVIGERQLREPLALGAARIADAGLPLGAVGLACPRAKRSPPACTKNDVSPALLEDGDRAIDGVALGDAAEADLGLVLGEHHRLLRIVDDDVLEADEGKPRLDVLVGRRMRIEILVELPEPVQRLERDVERAFGDLARVDRVLDDRERLVADRDRQPCRRRR